jgi:hypothetical protein
MQGEKQMNEYLHISEIARLFNISQPLAVKWGREAEQTNPANVQRIGNLKLVKTSYIEARARLMKAQLLDAAARLPVAPWFAVVEQETHVTDDLKPYLTEKP